MKIDIEKLRIGNATIDRQHMSIVGLFKRIAELIINHRKVEAHDTINALLQLCELHFKVEEAVMDFINFKFKKDHKNEHRLFINKLERYRYHIFTDQAESDLILELEQWFLNHICKRDKEYMKAFNTALKEGTIPEGETPKDCRKFFSRRTD